MEASTLHAPAALARTRIAIGPPLLRLRSDDQLVALFRAGHDEAFAVIHERYHKRLLAYARQMLPIRQDAEDALQDVFVRAHSGLRTTTGRLALRAWLFRIAHNRCIDELRRPVPPPPEVLELMRSSVQDPIAQAEQRESLRRLIDDVRRLPDQQRSALLMRELGGMSYAELATALGVTIPALKSLLVRARVGLAQAAQARDTDCGDIRDEIATAHDRGSRPNANARKHMRDCSACRGFRRDVRGISKNLAAVAPAAGPLTFLAHVLGFSGGASSSAGAGGATAGAGTATGATAGAGTATGATAGAGAAAGGAVAGGSAAAGGSLAAIGAGHVATVIAAAVATAGGAIEIQHTIAPSARPAHVRVTTTNPAAPLLDTDSSNSATPVTATLTAAAARRAARSVASIGMAAAPVSQGASGESQRATGGQPPSDGKTSGPPTKNVSTGPASGPAAASTLSPGASVTGAASSTLNPSSSATAPASSSGTSGAAAGTGSGQSASSTGASSSGSAGGSASSPTSTDTSGGGGQSGSTSAGSSAGSSTSGSDSSGSSGSSGTSSSGSSTGSSSGAS